MFGPVRGPWEDGSWTGWWEDNPPCRTPVFVLTHHARAHYREGGTTFYFVTEGIKSALKKAKAAAKGKDVRMGGGVATIRQYLTAGQIDEIHLALTPMFLGEGEHLFAGLNLPAHGFTWIQTVASEKATHVLIKRGEKLE
jgi:dihydrofolate reductase